MLTPHTKDVSSQSKDYYCGVIRMTDESGTYMRQRQLTVTRSTKAEALQDAVAEIEYIEKTKPEAAKRLGQIREALNSKNVSYGELVELQSMVEYIDPSDAQLLEAAGA